MKARSAKAKGTKLEKYVATQLKDIGITARRQPGSGIFQDWPHDAAFELGGDEYLIECKSWKHGWRTGDRAMGKADMLVIKRDFGEPRVYLTWGTFKSLVEKAIEGGATNDLGRKNTEQNLPGA